MILPGILAAMRAYETETGERLQAMAISAHALELLHSELGRNACYRIDGSGRCAGVMVDGCAIGVDGSGR